MSIKQQAVSSIKWQVTASLIQKAVTFGTTIILARRLGPSVYGLFAFCLVIVSSFELFKSMGIDAALIRRKNDFREAADTAFIIIPLLGLTLYAALNASAPFLGRLLGNAEIAPVVRVLGLLFVVGCFTKVPVISLERRLEFKGISVAEGCGTIMFSATAVFLVFMNYGIWTLVFAYIARTFTYMVIVWLFSGWKPRFRFNTALAREMFGFGKFVFLTSVLWFLKSNLDNLLVGKLLGATMLGYYAVARNISGFGPEYFGGRISRVIYPAYSKLQTDTAGMKKAFLTVLKYIGLIALPLGAGTFFFGGDFIRLGYGEKWTDAIPVLRMLSMLAVSNMLIVATDSIFMAIGKPQISLWSAALQVSIFFALVTPAAKHFGLTGVAFVVLSASLAEVSFQCVMVMKHLSVSMADILYTLRPPALAAAVMVFITMALKQGSAPLFGGEYYRYTFIAEFVCAPCVYLGSLYLTSRQTLRDVKKMLLPSME